MVPICAARADPEEAATTRPVMNGPISRSIAMQTSMPMLVSWPYRRSSRPTWRARIMPVKIATIITTWRLLMPAMNICARVSPTCRSDFVKPGTSMFVDSQRNASTPFSP